MASLRDLLKSGAISVGDVLVWEKKQSKTVHTVTVQADGTLKASSGAIYRTPSNAAKQLNGGIAINGWRVWRLQRNSKSLLEIRETAGFKVAKRSVVNPPEAHNQQ
jgi:hypothetical protein